MSADTGKLCTQCNAIVGYTPHTPWCGFYRPADVIGAQLAQERENYMADTHARASEMTFDILTSNPWDRAFLRGMQIAVNNDEPNAAQR